MLEFLFSWANEGARSVRAHPLSESSSHQGVALRAPHWSSFRFLFKSLETAARTHPEPSRAPLDLQAVQAANNKQASQQNGTDVHWG